MSKPKLNQPDVETTTTIGAWSTSTSASTSASTKRSIPITSSPKPTLEEVIKEWKELGYDLTRHERLFLEFEKGDTYIMLYNYETVKYEKYSYAYSQKITLKEHNLLTKTFRALGWEV